MAVPAIDATASGADANSYVTETEALEYFELRPGTTRWDTISANERRAALIFARILIERETFWGTKSAATQALQFPRSPDTSVPLAVKHAQMEQALDVIDGGYLKRLHQDELQEAGIRQVMTVDTQMRAIPTRPNAFPMYKLCSTARALLQPYIDSSVIAGRA
jgi:hypothetical protein